MSCAVIINTKPHCEYKVIAQLEREGSVAYLPLARRWRRPHGRRRPYLAEVPGLSKLPLHEAAGAGATAGVWTFAYRSRRILHDR